MIAELYGKISKTGSNLTERLEDQLTGNFFGSLRYLPFNIGMKPLLQKSVSKPETLDSINDLHLDAWHEDIHFWTDCKWDGVEPDVVIEGGETVILVEVKLDSGLSSDDETSEATETISQQETEKSDSNNQLGRESRLLANKYPDAKKRILLLLAPEASAARIYKNIEERETRGEKIIAEGVSFDFVTWQKVLTALKEIEKEITCCDVFQGLIVQDLIRLLKHKGFEQFNNFFVDNMPDIDPDVFWPYEYTVIPEFRFVFTNRIKEDLYYEFK